MPGGGHRAGSERAPQPSPATARAQVVMGYMVGVAAMLAAFYFTPASMPKLQWATVFMIGFFLYGPQMLIGLCGAELARPALNSNHIP